MPYRLAMRLCVPVFTVLSHRPLTPALYKKKEVKNEYPGADTRRREGGIRTRTLELLASLAFA